MIIRKLDTTLRKDVNAFLDFPFKLYKDNPYWVPPMRSGMVSLLRRRNHPYYLHSAGDFFVAESEGETLGCIAALYNINYNQYHNTRSAFLYYFDCIDDEQVAAGLLDSAVDWGKSHGADLLFGPKGFSRMNGSGLLIEGFNQRATVGVPYNLPYYQKFFEHFGFEKEVDYVSGYVTRSDHFDPRIYAIAEKVKERGNFWIKTFRSKREIRKYIYEVNRIHDEAFQGIIDFQFYPSTKEEFKMMADSIIFVADLNIMKLIMKGDEVAGFVIEYPDIAEAIQKTHGRLFPFGWITILHAIHHSTDFSLNGIGILPKYQGLGSNALLYTEIEKTVRAHRYQRAESIQVQEKNFRSKDDMESLGVRWVKKHRIYKKSIQ